MSNSAFVHHCILHMQVGNLKNIYHFILSDATYGYSWRRTEQYERSIRPIQFHEDKMRTIALQREENVHLCIHTMLHLCRYINWDFILCTWINLHYIQLGLMVYASTWNNSQFVFQHNLSTTAHTYHRILSTHLTRIITLHGCKCRLGMSCSRNCYRWRRRVIVLLMIPSGILSGPLWVQLMLNNTETLSYITNRKISHSLGQKNAQCMCYVDRCLSSCNRLQPFIDSICFCSKMWDRHRVQWV